ncbi:MAG: 6-pyruvoyltetrahydropterin/6-carboxytetrahydropterin synthase [Verrucomicrobiota bacterium]|jgi:6-pyruvoyltetrahydropterin/6-carboxytetrahydropterin synthase
MLLTVSKRLEFSASRRLFVKGWSEVENLIAFGPETSARFGTGRNYVAYFVFSGRVDPVTGMLMNISEIKERVGQVLRDGFDHKFLNENNPAFAALPPTAENIARQLFLDAAPLFRDSSAELVACHLLESQERSATYFATGISEASYWFEFSAARQTMSPRLSPEENQNLFCVAASPFGHGHNYRARLTFRAGRDAGEGPMVRFEAIAGVMQSLRRELDHKNLNREVPGLTNQPITTENLARYIHERVREALPLHRVRLHERADFFAEYWLEGNYFLGLQLPFSAAHRLHSEKLRAEENVALYGKCNNPLGHGHLYLTEATIGGAFDERSGTLWDFGALQRGIADALEPWQNKHLNIEMEEFRDNPTTGENIVQALWPRFDSRLEGRLVRLRLWETANNRFTLRNLDTLVPSD